MYVPCVSELDLTYRWPWVSVGDRVNVFNLRQNETAWARYDLRQCALASGHLICPGHRLLAWAALPRLQTQPYRGNRYRVYGNPILNAKSQKSSLDRVPGEELMADRASRCF